MVKIKEGDLISRAHMRYLSKAKITGMYLCEIIAVLSIIIGALSLLYLGKTKNHPFL